VLQAAQRTWKLTGPLAGRLREAAKLYRKAIDANPYHDLGLMSYGVCLADKAIYAKV